MFDIGFWELLIIFALGLLVLGPERLPQAASTVGRWVGRARMMARSLRIQMEQEIAASESNTPKTPPERQSDNATSSPVTDDDKKG